MTLPGASFGNLPGYSRDAEWLLDSPEEQPGSVRVGINLSLALFLLDEAFGVKLVFFFFFFPLDPFVFSIRALLVPE